MTRNSSLLEIVNDLYLNAIIQNYNKLSIWLKPVPTSYPTWLKLLTGNPAKHVKPIILFICLERRKKGTYTVLYVRLGGQCWYHCMLAFPVPSPASLAMQIGTCKTKVNKDLHKAEEKGESIPTLAFTACSLHILESTEVI